MFKVLEERLGVVCPLNNLEAEFLVVASNVNTPEKLVALVSTLPLYHYGISSANSLYWGNLNDSITNYLEVWDSSDYGDTWVKRTSGSIGNLTYNSGSEYWTCSSTSGFGFAQYGVVEYSNYPILYACRKHSGAVANSLFNTTENRPLYRDADVPYPLKRVPYGAIIRFGRWKKEETDGDVHDLFWYVQDYTRRLRVYSEIANYPENCVYLTSKHIIDVLTYNNHKNYNREECYDGNANLPKWLNSNKKEWWFSSGEGDAPPSVENMQSAFTKYAYSDKAGFLHRFSNGEISLMQPSELEAIKYKTDHVTLFYWAEFYASRGETATHNTLLTRSAFARTRNYHIAMLKGANAITSSMGNDAYTLSSYSEYRWSRNKKGSSQGYKPDGTATLAYEAQPVVPTCFISDDTMIAGIDDEGFFTLEIPEVGTPVEADYKVEREIRNNIDTSFETEKEVLNNIDAVFESSRELGNNYSVEYPTLRTGTAFYVYNTPTKREIHNSTSISYMTQRDVLEEVAFDVNFSAERKVCNSFNKKVGHTKRYVFGLFDVEIPDTRRRIANSIVKDYEAIRNISWDVEYSYDGTKRDIANNVSRLNETTRKTCNSFDVSFKSERTVIYADIFEYPTSRKISEKVENFLEKATKRVVANSCENTFDTLRYIAKPTVVDYPSLRITLERYTNLHPTKRIVTKNANSVYYNTIRNIVESSETIAEAKRVILNNSESSYDLVRNIANSLDFEALCKRIILENANEPYELNRVIHENSEEIYDISRTILENCDEAYDLERVVVENCDEGYELNRVVCENTEEEWGVHRVILENCNANHPCKRDIRNNIDHTYGTVRNIDYISSRYVNKDNLALYTYLLKQEIEAYVEARVEQILKEKGL